MRTALHHMMRQSSQHEALRLASLVLLDAGAYASASAAVRTTGGHGAPAAQHALPALIAAVLLSDHPAKPLLLPPLAQVAAPALIEWRAAPSRDRSPIGSDPDGHVLIGLASVVDAFIADPPAFSAAIDIILQDGDWAAVDACLDTLGPSGWSTLDPERQDRLYAATLATVPAALGSVWSALTDAQRDAAAARLSDQESHLALFIQRLDDAARHAVASRPEARPSPDASLWRAPPVAIWECLPADLRAQMIDDIIQRRDGGAAHMLLHRLGARRRALLTDAQRAALDRCSAAEQGWLTLLLRAVDGGWFALSDDDRARALQWAEGPDPFAASDLLRAIGAAGWRSMTDADRERLGAAIRRSPDTIFRCPPSLWRTVHGGRLPPPSRIPPAAIETWRVEDVDDDLHDLDPAYQVAIFALAPWRAKDSDPSAPRLTRLIAAWRATDRDGRNDVAAANPAVLAVLAAAAQVRNDRNLLAVLVPSLAATVAHDHLHVVAKETVGRLLMRGARWRPWMSAFAPTSDDPPDVWRVWRRAITAGRVNDRMVCTSALYDKTSRARRER